MIFRKRKTPATATQDETQRRDERRREAAVQQERWRQASAQARAEREREEAAREAEARQESAAEIAEAIRLQGFWWPGEPTPEGRLSGHSWRSRLLGAIFGSWR